MNCGALGPTGKCGACRGLWACEDHVHLPAPGPQRDAGHGVSDGGRAASAREGGRGGVGGVGARVRKGAVGHEARETPGRRGVFSLLFLAHERAVRRRRASKEGEGHSHSEAMDFLRSCSWGEGAVYRCIYMRTWEARSCTIR